MRGPASRVRGVVRGVRGVPAIAVALVLAACTRPAPPPACEASLDGVWRTGAIVAGEAIGYHFLDRRGAIEGYPTFRDIPADLPPGVRAAPAVIDLLRTDVRISGRWSRRYELGGARCTMTAAVRVARCQGRELVLELSPLAPPTDWSRCPKPGLPPPPATAPPIVLTLRR